MADVEVLKKSEVQAAIDAFNAAKSDLAAGLSDAETAISNLETNDAQVQTAIDQLDSAVATANAYGPVTFQRGFAGDDDLTVKPATGNGEVEDDISYYFKNGNVFQLIRLESGSWVDFSKPNATKEYVDDKASLLQADIDDIINSEKYYSDQFDTGEGKYLIPYPNFDVALEVGDRLGIRRSSKFRDEIIANQLDLAITAYEVGQLPIINASDVVTGWAKTSGQTNVYEVAWDPVFSRPTISFVSAWESDFVLVRQTSIANVDANAGSYYHDDVNGIMYLHTSGSDNPATNGKAYELGARGHCINNRSNDNAYIEGLHLKRAVDDNGCLDAGLNLTAKKLLLEDGGKHHAVAESGIFEDVICIGAQVDRTGIALTFYTATGGGIDVLYTRCGVIGFANNRPSTLFAHVSSAATDLYQKVTCDQCFGYQVNNLPSAQADAVIYTNLYFEDFSRQQNNGYNNDINRCHFNGANIYDGVSCFEVLSGGSLIFKNSCIIMEAELVQKRSINASMSDLTCDIDNAVFINIDDPNYTTGMHLQIKESPVTCHNSILKAPGVNFSFIEKNTGAGSYVGDYNIFIFTGSVAPIWKFEGTTCTTLQQWQTESGQDANSVYVSPAQAASFWLNDPLSGDLRINPNAEVTAGDGTVYTGTFPDGTPLSEAGVQEHWDYNNRRVVDSPLESFPSIPKNMADAKKYVKSPEDWTF